MKIGRLNRASFAKTVRRAMFLFAFAVLGTQAATGTGSVDFAAFVDALKAANNTFDGSTHALAQNGKLTVKWSPVSGCYDTREGHECTVVGNVAATANTPKRVNSGLTQFQLFEGESHAVNVKNVAFVYEPAAFTVCENSGWKGTFTAEQAPAGQIYLMNTGDVTFEGCTFDKVVLTSFNCTGTSTVKDCSFKNVYNSYAVKDIRGATISVTGCTFENCGAAVMVSSTVKVGAVTISGNTFKNVDVAGTAPESKVGTRGLVQIASLGNYAETAFDFSGNTATDCGPVLRQLNETVSIDVEDKADLNKLVSTGGSLYTGDSVPAAKIGEKKYDSLEAALADVAEGKPLTWVAEGSWPVKTPVYYNGTFYETGTGFAAKGALERAIDAANAEGAAAVAKIYVRPGFAADELVLQAHQQLKTGLAIYGNDAKLSRNWEPCVEYPGTSGDSGAHQLTKDVSLAIYNLHNGAGFWGRRTTAYTVDLKLSGCQNAHQVMFYGNADTGVKGKTNISVTNCTFDATNKKTDHNVLVTIGAGAVDVSDTTFTAANINVKNVDGGDNVITVKDCTFKDTVAGNQNIRVRSYVEGTHADLTIENVTFAGDSTQNVEIGDSKAECKGVVNYTITKTSGTMNVYKQGVTTAEATTLDAAVAYSGDNVGTIADEKALRRAFCAAPTDGTAVTVTLGADITLETLYAAENFGTEKLDDNAEGDTFNRYKVGVHPTAEDPNHWNPLVTEQTQEQRLVYGAYYHMSATDERIARLVVKSGQKIVLDLNGHTIQKNARANHGDWSVVCTDIIGNYGTLEIMDSSTGAKGTIKGIGYISCQGAVLHNYAGAKMTVTGVNVDGNAAGMAKGTGQYVIANDGGTLTIDGANVFDTATTADASLVVNTAGTVTITGNATLNHPTTKTVNVKGGVVNVESATIISDTYAIYAKSGTVNVNGLTVSGSGTLAVDGNTATITKKPGVELPAPSGFMWVENDGKQVLKSFVAKVGETAYVTIAEAFAALSAESHTLTLLNENAWDATTPVYWAAGTQKGYAATLAKALTAAYKANEGAITIVCRPGADVGEMTHGHIADDLTIYGNDAYLSGGECDLEVDTYTFSRATGKQAADGVCLDKDITITAYELDNLGVWGERHTANTVTVNLTDCDGKALEGKTNVQRVYISGTTGVNNITLTDCDFLTKATAVYSNADGAIKAVNCSFTGGQVPFNINHKANGTQTVAVENCTFTNCGDTDGWKQFAAPLRLVNSGAGTQSAEVTGCAFAGTVGANGDILLGDGRTGQASNDVELKVVDTAANIQAQKPGYYNGETVDETKKATATSPAEGTLETSVAKLLPVNNGSEAHPYSREQFAAMTRAEYIAAQKRLGGTLYVNVGDYAYEKDGVLGNGVRNDTTGQIPDHAKLNAYGENGYLGEKNDGANGHTVVFVGGTITSGVTGYTSIDSIGTSLLLAVPAYTKVTFKGTAFKNVLSFDYQLYTSPWSQLGGLTFNGCTFDGIIVGAIASQELAFNGCTFNNYVNTTDANSSNPTWIRPAYGNWTKGDNEGQGTGFRSLTKITFENNTVTSTRPVKFERIAQWEMETTVRATDNAFDITPQEGDTSPKNVGLYFGANAKFDLVADNNTKSDGTAALYTAAYKAPNGTDYDGLPAGSTVKNTAGEDVTIDDARVWKKTDTLTLKTTEEVASVTNAKGVSVNFATLSDAIAAAKDGETVKLLADTNGDGIAIAPNTFKTGLTVDFGGHTYTVGGLLVGSSGTASNGFQLNAGNRITFKNGAIVGATATAGTGTDWKGAPAILIQNYCDLTLEQMTVKGGDETCYTLSNNNGEIVIDGSTIVAGKGTKYGPFAFDVCRYANYPSVHVTVKGASVIEGNVEISGTIGDNQSRQLDIEGVTFKGAFKVVNQPANIAISGGTFSDAVLPEYCAAGFIPTANDDGTYGVKAGAYVAAIGTTGYETLEAALAAADAGATVKMLADVVLTEKQTIAKALVLDLNGKTISSTVNQFITIAKGGDLTVNDATGEGRIENTVTESWGGTIKMTGGVLTVNGGTIAANSATSEYSPTIEADTSSSATINVMGGRIEADRTGNARAINLRAQANVTLNVTGGEIVGSQNGIYSFAGNTINISAGVVAGKAGSAVYSSGKNRVLISGGTLTPGGTASALYISMGSSATVTIGREGGKVDDVTIPSIDVGGCATTVTLLSGTVRAFKNWDSMAVEKVSQGKDKLLVGTDITACLPGSDLLCQLDAASGLYEIIKLTVENAAAIVTHDDVETPYHTVEQACKAVTDGDTLTLKVDHTGSQTLSFSAKNVTVDLGGKTLTYTGATGGLSSALSFNQSTASDNTVTVKNGTIVAKAQDATCVRAEMTGDLSKTLTVVFGENLTLTSGNTSRYGGVVFGTGARTASPCEKMTKGGLLVTEGEEVWIYGETATAFTHAKGSEVTLLNDWYDTDTKGTVKVPSSGTFASAKLNLNGHTINSYGVNPAVLMGMVGENEDTAAKTLEISSGTIKTFRHGAAVCGSNKTLTLDGVTLTTTGDKMYGLYANGTTSGNTVTLKNKSAVLSEKATGIYFPGAGTLTVEDSNVTGGVSGIEVRAGVLNVSGTSVIESTATAFDFTNNDNGTTTTGAAVAAVKHTVGNDLAVTITGGTFKGPRGFYANDPNVAKPGKVTVSISGGVFSTDVEKKYLADGCKTVQQTIDGTLYYVVGPAITQIGVTLGGEKKEMPFPDAWLVANIGADASSWTTAALEEKAANGLAKWQCYLFGLDPSKKDAKVVATAGQGTDKAIPLTVANADASASPLVKGGYVTVAYVLMGSNDRTAWTQVATFDKRDDLAIPLTDTTYKFYRVDVTVTSAEGN